MPQFSYSDRQAVAAEGALWAIHESLRSIDMDNAWMDKVKEITKEVSELANEIRDYNDQFEEE